MSETITMDWQKSPAHLFLLSTFLRPRTVEGFPITVDWKLILGEDPCTVVDRWLIQGILQHASLSEHIAYKFTVSDLKAMLRDRGLPQAGRKDDLILRILQADPNGIKQATVGLSLLECSEEGRRIAEQYLSGSLTTLANDNTLPPETVVNAIKWILVAAVSGVIGNAVYDALKQFLAKQKPKGEEENSVSPTEFSIATESYNLGGQYADAGDYERAIAEYTKAIELDPQHLLAYHSRGVVYEHLRDYQKAVADYGETIEIDSQFAFAYHGRGVAYAGLGNYQQAIIEYSKAIELNPMFASAYHNRGIVYIDIGNYQRAVDEYVTANDPSSEHTFTKNSKKDYLDYYRQSINDFSKAIDLDPQYVSAYLGRGIAYENLLDFHKALDEYDRAIELDPNYAPAYEGRGSAFCSLGDYQRAVVELTKAIDLDPKLATARLDLGKVYEYSGNKHQAIIEYTKAIRIDQKYALAYYYRGNVYESLDDYQQAIDDYRNAFKYDNDKSLYGKILNRIEKLKYKLRWIH